MKIVKFVQPACAPCRMVDGLLKHLSLTVDETVDIVCDEKGLELAQSLGVKSTPTLILFDGDGKEVERVSGMNQDGIRSMFDKRG